VCSGYAASRESSATGQRKRGRGGGEEGKRGGGKKKREGRQPGNNGGADGRGVGTQPTPERGRKWGGAPGEGQEGEGKCAASAQGGCVNVMVWTGDTPATEKKEQEEMHYLY